MRLNPWWLAGGAGVLLLLTSKQAVAAVTQILPKDARTKKILEIAAARNIPPAVALAIFDIESGGAGFSSKTGKMIIRYEPHIFRKRSGGKEVPANRGGQAAEWDNFARASAVDPEAAMKSISMGMAQVMGFNHKMIGYPTVKAMFDALSSGEEPQILSFFDFIKSAGLEDEARAGKWTAFARGYNGAGQKGYDTKMAARYKHYVDRGYAGISGGALA